MRKELERSWRVFTRDPAAAFRIITDKDEALRVLSTMETQQGDRMQHLGLNFVLNDETYAAFYRNLVETNVANGYAVLSALTVGDEVVATLLGIRQGARYVMVRISNAGEKWSNCSPGRLIIERTMAALHKDGIRQFDFSIGNYAYKRRFGVAPDCAGGFHRGAELARTALCAARSRGALASQPSKAGGTRKARTGQTCVTRREVNLPGRAALRVAHTSYAACRGGAEQARHHQRRAIACSGLRAAGSRQIRSCVPVPNGFWAAHDERTAPSRISHAVFSRSPRSRVLDNARRPARFRTAGGCRRRR